MAYVDGCIANEPANIFQLKHAPPNAGVADQY
jgi:hypothetical protein